MYVNILEIHLSHRMTKSLQHHQIHFKMEYTYSTSKVYRELNRKISFLNRKYASSRKYILLRLSLQFTAENIKQTLNLLFIHRAAREVSDVLITLYALCPCSIRNRE